ncbi:MAG: ABATE domain-containing protein [Anaerolineales bacterium]|jgi:predicted RNA-binding Zn ribbon-like protein
MRARREAEIHRLIGGELCLDFANTLNGHHRLRQHEYLHGYQDLLRWSLHADVLLPRDARRLSKIALASPARAASAYQKAIALRETIFSIFAALAGEREPRADQLDQLNAAWHEGQRHTRLVRMSDGFAMKWDDNSSLESILQPISSSAVDLLTSKNIRRVRGCQGVDCDWLFLDTSRNHLRRWCSMEECGNRAKMHRRQLRQKRTVA